MHILRDIKSGERFNIRLCHQCDPSTYPKGKPILPTDMNTKKDDKENWVFSECQTEDLNRMFLHTLGPNHPKCQAFIAAEDKQVLKHNNAARRLNEKAGQHLMSYKRNRYGQYAIITKQMIYHLTRCL